MKAKKIISIIAVAFLIVSFIAPFFIYFLDSGNSESQINTSQSK